MNGELAEILKGQGLVKYDRSIRLRFPSHVERMKQERMPKHLLRRYIIQVTMQGTPWRR